MSDVDTVSVSVAVGMLAVAPIIVCVAASCSMTSSSSCGLSSSNGGAVGIKGSGMSLFSSKRNDFLALLLLFVGGGHPAVYRPGSFSGGGTTTPCAFAIGIFVRDTVCALAIVAGFAAVVFALNFRLTSLVLSLALENMARYLLTPFVSLCTSTKPIFPLMSVSLLCL